MSRDRVLCNDVMKISNGVMIKNIIASVYQIIARKSGDYFRNNLKIKYGVMKIVSKMPDLLISSSRQA